MACRVTHQTPISVRVPSRNTVSRQSQKRNEEEQEQMKKDLNSIIAAERERRAEDATKVLSCPRSGPQDPRDALGPAGVLLANHPNRAFAWVGAGIHDAGTVLCCHRAPPKWVTADGRIISPRACSCLRGEGSIETSQTPCVSLRAMPRLLAGLHVFSGPPGQHRGNHTEHIGPRSRLLHPSRLTSPLH